MVDLASLFHIFCIWECCSKQWVPKNMTELDLRLKDHLMGQPLAHDLILNSISSHINTENPSKALVLSLHGSTGTEYKDRIKKDIEKATSACQHATFVFDEVDKMPVQLLETILYYIDFHTPTYAQPIDFRKTIFIFLSNTGGKDINIIAQNNHFSSIERRDYNITEFQRALANAAFSEAGGLWHASLINRHLVTFFVPFLPLEHSHVRTCIQRQLDLARESEEYDYNKSDNDIVNNVLDLIEFAPPETLLYSVSGCKKVQQKLDFILERIRIQVLQKRLESKSKAFAILINELDTLKYERNQFKSLADSLQEKYVQLKKQTTKKIEPLNAVYPTQTIYEHPNDIDPISLKEKEVCSVHNLLLKTALKTVQDEKEVLQTKVDELTRELDDVKGDLSIFRQKRYCSWNDNHQVENDNETTLLERLEQANERILQLENDLKLLVCQKEELEIERDSFKNKSNKLNKMFSGNENSLVDIELILSENQYFKEKLNEITREKDLAIANATKYKELLQSHQSEKIQSSGSILTYKQVRSLINQSYILPNTPEIENDLRAIAEALFENLKDKNVTIVHQRKINKILANRIAELEKRLVQCKMTPKSEQASSLIDLLDRTPSPDAKTSQFVNSTDHLQQLSSSQVFKFPTTWPSSPSPSITRTSSMDITATKPNTIQYSTTATKNTLEYHQSTKIRNHSDNTDLEMEDPSQSPSLLTSPIAYLEEQDLLPSSTSDSDSHPTQDLLKKTRQSSNSTAVTNLTC
ncbi:hypothetical protein I4U23_013464 [Adineta vaga]|nr:hypothetical protein I4U23_013464 [Adineta vaga]